MHARMLKNFVIIFLAMALFQGCKKFDDEQALETPGFEDLQIANNFNWNTTENLRLNVYSENSSLIRITSTDGKITYHKGYFNKLQDYYTVTINLPAYIESIAINGQKVTINGNPLLVDLNAKNKFLIVENNKAVEIDDLISQWHFDENQGSTAYDSEGNNDGSFIGAEWVQGISGSALDYNGTDGHTLVPNSASLNITSDKISHSLWFKLDHVGDDGCFLFHRTKYIIRIDKLGKLLFGIYNPDWSHANIGWSNRIIDTDWHHLVTTYDGEVMKMYLDGELMSTESSNGDLRSSSSDIYIGNQSSINFFDGSIDEVAIYEKALTASEVRQLYNSTPNPGNGSDHLISEWLLNENGGNTAFDSESNNDGTITGASWEPGVTGSCLAFDGENDYVIIPNADNLNPVSALSIMAWAKTNENKTAKVAQKGDWDGHGIFQGKWNGWKASIRTADDESHSLNWENGIPILNEWYHICLTYDGNHMKLYINGQLKSSREISGDLRVNSRSFSIGSDNGAQKYFNGSIDDVRFYSVALSQTEIQAVFNNQSTANDSDGDGIADNDDDYPNDPARAFENFYPAAGYESMAFEDLWPGTGDYDFNDLVLDYRFTIITNANNKVSDLNGSFIVRVIGAGYNNGFGFQIESEEISASDLEASGFVLSESYINLNDNGTENAQDKVTFIVFDNAKSILPSAGGFGVNVDPSAPYVEPDTVNLNISFSNLTYSIEELNMSNFNPFLIVDGERGKEIHLPGFPPTSLANTAYFGTMHDNTNPSIGNYYKTTNNLPWALRIAESYEYTNEKAQIINAYLKFADWAESSGSIYPDWYQNKTGYRNNTLLYQTPND